MHCVNLGESFPTSIYLQNLACLLAGLLRYSQERALLFRDFELSEIWICTSKFLSAYLQPSILFGDCRARQDQAVDVHVGDGECRVILQNAIDVNERNHHRRIEVRVSLQAFQIVVDTLIERFDIEPYFDFSAKWANFIGLVLFCIGAKFCKKIFVGKLSTRSTRVTCFCTAQTSTFQEKIFKILLILTIRADNLQNFAYFDIFW